jgi:hypothetical protein
MSHSLCNYFQLRLFLWIFRTLDLEICRVNKIDFGIVSLSANFFEAFTRDCIYLLIIFCIFDKILIIMYIVNIITKQQVSLHIHSQLS